MLLSLYDCLFLWKYFCFVNIMATNRSLSLQGFEMNRILGRNSLLRIFSTI